MLPPDLREMERRLQELTREGAAAVQAQDYERAAQLKEQTDKIQKTFVDRQGGLAGRQGHRRGDHRRRRHRRHRERLDRHPGAAHEGGGGREAPQDGGAPARARDRPGQGGRRRVRGRAPRPRRASRTRSGRSARSSSSARRAWARPSSPGRWPSSCSTTRAAMVRLDMSEYMEKFSVSPPRRLAARLRGLRGGRPAHRGGPPAPVQRRALRRDREGAPGRVQHAAAGAGRRPAHRQQGPHRRLQEHRRHHDQQRGRRAHPRRRDDGEGLRRRREPAHGRAAADVPARVPQPHRRDHRLPRPRPRPSSSRSSTCCSSTCAGWSRARACTSRCPRRRAASWPTPGTTRSSGARPLKRAIQRLIENPLSRELLGGGVPRGRHHQGGRAATARWCSRSSARADIVAAWARRAVGPRRRDRRRGRSGARAATRRVAARGARPAATRRASRPGRRPRLRRDAVRGGGRAPVRAQGGASRAARCRSARHARRRRRWMMPAPASRRSRDSGFKELEVVAYIGEFKIVGIAHFGVGQRASSRRPSDYIRAFSDTRLTLSKVRIYDKGSQDLRRDGALHHPQPRQGRLPLRARGRRSERGGLTATAVTYQLDILIPTARFVFSVEGDAVDVLPEHRSPEAFVEYRALRERRPVVGMTTFPNTVLLRGPRTIVVDPGLPLQNDPVLRALEARGLSAADVDLVVLTHAHLDHAGGCAVRHGARRGPRARDASAVLGARRRAARVAAAGAADRRRRRAGARRRVGAHARPLRRAHQPGRRHRPRGGSCCAATPSAPAGTSSTPWRRLARPLRSPWPRGGASAPGSRPRRRRPPAAVRSVRPAARRSVPRPACATLRPLVTTSGRLLRAYLRVPV